MEHLTFKTIDDFNKETDEFQKYLYIIIYKKTFQAFPLLQVKYSVLDSCVIYKIDNINNMVKCLYELEHHYIRLDIFRFLAHSMYSNTVNFIDACKRNKVYLEHLENIKYRDDLPK